MLIPYRVRYPITKFPYATVAIVGINVLVFAATSDHLLAIREDALRTYAFAWGASPWWTMLTAFFLHGDVAHIAGNMLFLWVFGRAVEDRLGVARFAAVYLIAGLAGDVLHTAVGSMTGHIAPTLGASGCIMGLLGAYWYLFSWSPVRVFYFIWAFIVVIRWGTFEIAAFWVIGAYFLLDVISGVFNSAIGVTGGVANFAHVGGAIAGALFCLIIGMKRDTGAVSSAKADLDQVKSLADLPLSRLVTMIEHEPKNTALIRALIGPATTTEQSDLIHTAMKNAGSDLIESDPELVCIYIADLGGDASIYPIGKLMWLANSRQHAGDGGRALRLYQRIVAGYPNAPDVETALCRMATIHWDVNHDAAAARECIETMLARFPFGPMAATGEALLRQVNQAA